MGDSGITQRRQEAEVTPQAFRSGVLGDVVPRPSPNSSVLVNLGAPACRRLISHAFSPHEVISLIEAALPSEEEIEMILDFRGDDAQSFVDVVHEVHLHIPSFLVHTVLITFLPFLPSPLNSRLPLIRI